MHADGFYFDFLQHISPVNGLEHLELFYDHALNYNGNYAGKGASKGEVFILASILAVYCKVIL